ncbi:hypothetical protein EPN90_01955 [Patescibacteria group bacterium]|nr:MAG: hypothetical protein EPN90_01955 [Patescibacteria group bacterium]
MAREFKIVPNPLNPSIADTVDAFARAFDVSSRWLTFKIDVIGSDGGLEVVELQLTSLTYESSSPGMFLVAGNLRTVGYKDTIQVVGHYNAVRRFGWLRQKE